MKIVQNHFKINSFVGNYVLKKKIGHGGIGTVYKATHKLLNHSAAVKVHEYFPESALVGISFLQSASYLAQLKHPNIVRLYDYGFYHGRAYMAMEYIDGTTLFNLMPKSNKENWSERAEEWTKEAIQLFMQLLSAVRYAHNCLYLDLAGNCKRGILHGDIKPCNILIERETSKLKLTDFMIPDVQAYLGKPKDSYGMFPIDLDFGDLSANDETKALTRRELAVLSERLRGQECISEVFGTPGYMAPEQQGGIVSVRTDIFTLGTTLYEILSGYSPAFRFKQRPRSDNPFIPKWVEEVILKSTHPDPSQRYNSVAEIEAIFQENKKKSNFAIKEWIMGDKIDVKIDDISGVSGQLFIGKFNNVITNLNNSGQTELANALTILKQAVVDSERITEKEKQEHIDVINKIGEESAKDKPNKTLIKAMGEGLLSILKAVPDVAKAVVAVTPFFASTP